MQSIKSGYLDLYTEMDVVAIAIETIVTDE